MIKNEADPGLKERRKNISMFPGKDVHVFPETRTSFWEEHLHSFSPLEICKRKIVSLKEKMRL